MQPESSDRLQGTLAAIRAFVREEVQPLEAQFLTQPYRTILPALNDLRARVKELNLWAPHLPEIYGGMGFSLPEFARVSEELGGAPLGHYVFNCQAPDVGNMELLL